jgi:phosphohistidine swiveling domain-containing protein
MALLKLVTRRFPPLQAFAYIVGHRDFVDFGYTYTASLPEGGEGNSIWLQEEEHFDHARRLGEIASSDSKFVPRLINDCYDRSDDLLTISKKIAGSQLAKTSDAELQQFFYQYFTAYLKLTRHLFTPHYVEISFTKTIREWLHIKVKGKASEGDINALFEVLAIATKGTQSTQREECLLSIANKIVRKGIASNLSMTSRDSLVSLSIADPEINKEVDEALKTYGWLPMINLGNQPMEREDFLNMLQKILLESTNPSEKMRVMKENNRAQKIKMEKTLQELGPSPKVLRQIKQLQEFIYLRTYRMEVYGESHFMILTLLEEIAKRAGISVSKLKFMTHEEILTFLQSRKRPSEQELDSRMKSYSILMENSKIYPIFAGQAAEEIKRQQLGASDAFESSSEIKGVPACMGVAVGPVRVIKDLADLSKVQAGDILVTIMTTTEYTPVLPKVAGIVTDEGGVTAHAAIVSRELGIPCVVGSKNATRLLHDGERVRVDATKGLVYRVE